MVFRLRGIASAMLLSAACAIAGAQTGAKIPEVKGTSFTNEAVNLPEMLRGKVAVLVVGFSQGSRDAVTGWGKRLAADYRESPTVVYYEMPVLAGVPRMIRGYVVGKIKASVSDVAKPRFVPVMDHEAEWRATANYKSGDDAYVLVVDETGAVRWQTRGAVTDAAYGAVREQVEALRAGIGHAVR